jgi:glyoxylate/hydroxypyruvate reductase A
MAILLAGEFDGDEAKRWLALLREQLPGETIVGQRSELRGEDIDIALVANPPPGALQGLPRLGLIQSLWAGVDRLLADPSLPGDVPVCRMVDPQMNEAMAQTALWAVLGLHRGFFAYAQRQRQQEWRVHRQRRADEVGVAVLGLGQMGAAAARRLVANGYPVTGWSLRPAQIEGVECHAGAAALPAVLAAAQVVVSLLPLTPATRGLFDAQAFAAMPRGAGFVNLARGAQVVDGDLLAALDSGHLGHAVLDVFQTEPLPSGHPFWLHPRVSMLPHAAALTDERSAAAVASANVRAWRTGQALAHVVDRQRGY